MKKLFLVSLMVVLVVGMILGGCAKKTTTTTTQTQTSTSTTTKTTTTTSEAPHKILKIGHVAALNIPTGVETKKWYELFAKLINEQGGWEIGADTYDVEMIVYDSQGDPAKARSYLEKLVLQDGVKFILNTPTSNPATDAEVTEPNKVICLGVDAIGNSADPKIQYYYTPVGMFFGMGFMHNVYVDMATKGAKTYVALKSDDMIGHATEGMCNAVWATAAPSVKYLETVFYDPSTADFGTVATKIMSLNPDVVDANFCITGAAPYNALYDVGYRGSVLPAMSPAILDAVITHTGTAFTDGWETGMTDPRMIPNQPSEIKALLDAYTAEYGTFQSDGCMWTAAWFVLKAAIDDTQSVDTDVIKAYLDAQPYAPRTLSGYAQLFARPEAGNFRTVSGHPADFIGVIKDGNITPLGPIAVKDHYLATIMAFGLADVYKAYWAQYGYPKFPAETSVMKFSDLGITGQD